MDAMVLAGQPRAPFEAGAAMRFLRPAGTTQRQYRAPPSRFDPSAAEARSRVAVRANCAPPRIGDDDHIPELGVRVLRPADLV